MVANEDLGARNTLNRLWQAFSIVVHNDLHVTKSPFR